MGLSEACRIGLREDEEGSLGVSRCKALVLLVGARGEEEVDSGRVGDGLLLVKLSDEE